MKEKGVGGGESKRTRWNLAQLSMSVKVKKAIIGRIMRGGCVRKRGKEKRAASGWERGE